MLVVVLNEDNDPSTLTDEVELFLLNIMKVTVQLQTFSLYWLWKQD